MADLHPYLEPSSLEGGLIPPVAVVYPEGTWYTFVDEADIDEIVDSHLRDGRVVERLVRAAATVARGT